MFCSADAADGGTDAWDYVWHGSVVTLLPSARVYGNAHTARRGIVAGMGVLASSLLLFKMV